MLKVENKLEISRENVPQFEQVAIIKFLTKEKTPSYEIFCRLEKIYKDKVLSQERISEMAARFSNNITTSDSSVFDDCQEVVNLTVNEDGQVLNIDSTHNFEGLICNSIQQYSGADNEEKSFSERTPLTRQKRFVSPIKRIKFKSKKAYLQTEFKQEAPDIELEFIDIEENEPEEGMHLLEEAVYENGLFDEKYIEGINLKNIRLPFLPVMSLEKATNVLVKLHTDCVCKLCNPKDLLFRSCLRRHILLAHAQRSVELDDQMSVRCRRSCVKDSKGHFHCPKCLKAFMTCRRLFVHFQRHFFKSGKPTSLLETNVIHTRCLCVDRETGVFMVQKSDIGGSTEPIHVKKTNSVSMCSEVLCQKAMSIAVEQNTAGFECKHLQRVPSNPSCKLEIYDLEINPLSSYRQECRYLLEFARQKKVSPVVEWSFNDNFFYYSVISQSSLAWFNRSMVNYIAEKLQFHCSTCITMPCVHCDLVTLYVNNK